MTDHSPTPWTAYEELDGTWSIDHAANGSVCTDGLSELDAKFIVQCVNRCHQLDKVLDENFRRTQKHILDELTKEAQELFRGYDPPTGNQSPWTGQPGDGF